MDDQLPVENNTPEESPTTNSAGDDELGQLRTRLAEREADLAVRAEHEVALVARLREAFITADPTLDPELVEGTTLAELEASVARARSVAERLRNVIGASEAHRVPAGAPGRTRVLPRSAFEKIREGLAPES